VIIRMSPIKRCVEAISGGGHQVAEHNEVLLLRTSALNIEMARKVTYS